MLEWTGERFLPWIAEPALAYEHIHRYVYAMPWVRGKSVLDLASGEGYGSHLLAGVAGRVVGVDIDEAAVRHAREKYQRSNLQFLSASVTKVPLTESHSFDAVTCFETIEHIEDQTELLAEIKRLLKPDGILLVSTPNKTAYDQETLDENPYHLKELDFPAFQDLIKKCFKHSRFLGQRIFANSDLWLVDGNNAPIHEYVMKRDGLEFDLSAGDQRVPLYYVAVASDAELPDNLSGSVLIDSGNELLLEKDREICALATSSRELTETRNENESGLAWRAEQLAQRDAAIQELEKAIAWRAQQVQVQEEGIESLRRAIADQQSTITSNEQALAWRARQVDELGSQITANEQALAWRSRQVDELEFQKAELQATLEGTLKRLGSVTWKLEGIQQSPGWNFILRTRKYREKLLPAGSLRHKALNRIIQLLTARKPSQRS